MFQQVYLKTIKGWRIDKCRGGNYKIVNTKDRNDFTFCNANGSFDSEYLVPKEVTIFIREHILSNQS